MITYNISIYLFSLLFFCCFLTPSLQPHLVSMCPYKQLWMLKFNSIYENVDKLFDFFHIFLRAGRCQKLYSVNVGGQMGQTRSHINPLLMCKCNICVVLPRGLVKEGFWLAWRCFHLHLATSWLLILLLILLYEFRPCDFTNTNISLGKFLRSGNSQFQNGCLSCK